MIWNTLRLAVPDLVAFAILFLAVYIGYCLMGYIAFGPYVKTFHNFLTSFWTCFSMLVSGDDETQIVRVQPVVASIFYVTYILFVVVILINMFIAIINQYYAKEKERTIDRKKKAKQEYSVQYDLYKQVSNFFKRLRPRIQLSNQSDDSDDENNDTYENTIYLQTGTTVMVMDIDYIQAERFRLRRLFQAAVHVIMICSRFWKLAGGVKFDFIDGVKYPENVSNSKRTILYLKSGSISSLNLLQSLRKKSRLVLSDESFSRDKVILECIDNKPLFRQYHYYKGSGYHAKLYKVVHGGSIIHNQGVKFPFYTYICQLYYSFITYCKTAYQNYLDTKFVKLDWGSFLLLSQEELREILVDLALNKKVRIRFDELVQKIRLSVAKKITRIGTENLNDRVEVFLNYI